MDSKKTKITTFSTDDARRVSGIVIVKGLPVSTSLRAGDSQADRNKMVTDTSQADRNKAQG